MQAQSTGASPFTQLKPHTPAIATGHQPCDLDGVLVGGPRGSLPQRPIGEPPPRPAQGPQHLAVEGRQVTGRPIRSLSVAEGVAGGSRLPEGAQAAFALRRPPQRHLAGGCGARPHPRAAIDQVHGWLRPQPEIPQCHAAYLATW